MKTETIEAKYFRTEQQKTKMVFTEMPLNFTAY